MKEASCCLIALDDQLSSSDDFEGQQRRRCIEYNQVERPAQSFFQPRSNLKAAVENHLPAWPAAQKNSNVNVAVWSGPAVRKRAKDIDGHNIFF